MKYAKELTALLKNTDDEIIEALTVLCKALLEDQKKIEASKYEDLLLPPSEAADIFRASNGSTLHMIQYGLDALRYYNPELMSFDASTRMLWTVAFLLEAGKIIGKRQERARRRAGKHGKE